MANNIEIVIENTGERVSIAQGTTLADMAKQRQSLCQYPILGALVNNELRPLDYHLYNPKCVRFIDIKHTLGHRMYVNSLTFMLYRAMCDCYPKAHLTVEHSLVGGVYVTIDFPAEEARPEAIEVAKTVRQRMIELQKANLPFEQKHMLLSDALELVKRENAQSTYNLLKNLNQLYIDMHFLDGIPHKLSTCLVPHTGCLTCWEFRPFGEGFMLQCPDNEYPDKLALYQETPKLFNIFQEHKRWAQLLEVPTIDDLNRIVRDHKENHLIHVAEALHEKKYATIADQIYQRRDEVKMVLLAGPSSSGKTTSCRRLAVQLSVLGFEVHELSLDDYFLPRSRTPRQPNGEYDFECVEALDIPLLNEHLMRLFNGEEVQIPTFDFIKGEPFFSGKSLHLTPRASRQPILLVEGIHALNPKLTEQIPDEWKYRVYVSAITQIAIDDQNFIHSSDNRLIRRIVRDFNFRGYSAYDTLRRWGSVRSGEHQHIFPFQENADIMFNSALLYELGILKPFAEPQLKKVPENTEEYAEAQRLLSFIELIEPIDPKHIPPTSILREFLGGSSFEY
ncbi:MAG: nucleoside kinase [Bacteroidales bacterium]|nr:nucleoside kinase [Bacteroidales bacterium]